MRKVTEAIDMQARQRLELYIEGDQASDRDAFGRDVRDGLTRANKRLSCRYFYDERGSQLFEEICALEEYYLPRAEREILERHAGEIAALAPSPLTLVELGSGSSTKTRLLIEALLARQGSLTYVPLDVSAEMLEQSSLSLLRDYGDLEIAGIAAEYQPGLARLAELARGPKLCLWLGSNIGNFDRPGAAAFLRTVRGALSAGDRLLVGVDLRKDRAVLEPAYDDARGVTAEFNKNVLRRINAELDGDFDLDGFSHRAVYREGPGKIEMYLVSRRAQRVRIGAIGLEVEIGDREPIHTEDSYKYSIEEIDQLANGAGLRIERLWLDSERRFCDALLSC